jgi:hypothetical protein
MLCGSDSQHCLASHVNTPPQKQILLHWPSLEMPKTSPLLPHQLRKSPKPDQTSENIPKFPAFTDYVRWYVIVLSH